MCNKHNIIFEDSFSTLVSFGRIEMIFRAKKIIINQNRNSIVEIKSHQLK